MTIPPCLNIPRRPRYKSIESNPTPYHTKRPSHQNPPASALPIQRAPITALRAHWLFGTQSMLRVHGILLVQSQVHQLRPFTGV